MKRHDELRVRSPPSHSGRVGHSQHPLEPGAEYSSRGPRRLEQQADGLHHRPQADAGDGGEGLLARSERYRSHVYEARIPKEQTQRQLAKNLLQRAFDGSAKSLVLGALSSQKVSAAELAEIRRMIDQFEKGSR